MSKTYFLPDPAWASSWSNQFTATMAPTPEEIMAAAKIMQQVKRELDNAMEEMIWGSPTPTTELTMPTNISEHIPFLNTIRANLDDDLPRLIYCDWLMDHGDQKRADQIREEIELSHLPTEPEETTQGRLGFTSYEEDKKSRCRHCKKENALCRYHHLAKSLDGQRIGMDIKRDHPTLQFPPEKLFITAFSSRGFFSHLQGDFHALAHIGPKLAPIHTITSIQVTSTPTEQEWFSNWATRDYHHKDFPKITIDERDLFARHSTNLEDHLDQLSQQALLRHILSHCHS